MPTTPVAKADPYAGMSVQQLAAMAQQLGYDVDTTGAKVTSGLSPKDQATMDAVTAGVGTTQKNFADATDFQSRNDETDTGGIQGSGLGQFLGGMGVPGFGRGSENYGDMRRVNLALAAANKPNAMPLRSQGEVQMLRGSAPDLSNPRATNAQFQQYYGNQMVQWNAKQAFYDSYAKVKGDLKGADQAWNKWSFQKFDARGAYIHPQAPAPGRAGAGAALQATSAPNAPQTDNSGWGKLGQATGP